MLIFKESAEIGTCVSLPSLNFISHCVGSFKNHKSVFTCPPLVLLVKICIRETRICFWDVSSKSSKSSHLNFLKRQSISWFILHVYQAGLPSCKTLHKISLWTRKEGFIPAASGT